MGQFSITLFYGFLLCISSCNTVDNKQYKETIQLIDDKVYNTKAEDILKDFETWYNYTYYNIHLAQEFIGLDTNSSSIDKSLFLDRLLTGRFIPLKINNINNLLTYKLYTTKNTNIDVTSTIRQMASNESLHYKMEGKEVPDFNFVDLNNVQYNKTTIKGKILVLKCWFIHCGACVKEFPDLNKLVDSYRQNSNIKFVSLAIDNKQELIPFLKKRSFNYAVIPDSEKYMTESLGIQRYPTHILINRSGKIVKVLNRIEDLIPFLKKELKVVFN